jgi:glycosyltransferase involved in cell wall biosynthesis
MKVALSVRGRYHAFDLARELQRQGLLAQLITTYPVCLAERSGVAGEHVSALPSNEVMLRLYNRLPLAVRRRFHAQLFLNERFERAARRKLRPADVLHAWSGSALGALGRARELGMLTVLERSSAHMLHQHRIVRDEYERLGIDETLVHPGVVDKELAEYAAADFICVPSRFVLDTFLAEGFAREKLLVVPYGTSMEHFYPSPKTDDVFRIIHCGYTSVEKGCHHLIEAFAKLRLPRAELWFVGGVAPHMRPFIERHRSQRIVFHGHQPQSELVRFYAQSSVFCAASLQDGFSVTVPQAMACGLPVIASTNVGAADILTPGVDGVIVPAGDVEALSAAIVRFYEAPTRCSEMGAAALQRVRSGFTWQDYGRRMAQAYTEALAARSSGTLAA